ncbi:uncharacterized protein LOC114262978 [Camellia sinensis]|uniref:uncharacterized protein LOC114262978 n=1 Tax=Camellia sinensis TaxID=4442 RepID=UPI0010365A78|nr:uncharacterized protein LOC114262978 [Camellia sinensis]
MAGHFPHCGGPPGTGDDPDIMALPLRVRPFIPKRYDPLTHVLPQAVFYHFTDFDDRAPGDLLLREPESHLSHQAREVTSRIARGYGSVTAREWYAELPEAVRDLVDLAGFGPFCSGISCCPASRTLMGALVERWWDTTNSFHFSATGDMTMTPFDFAVFTGLDMGGWVIPYNEDMGQWEAAWIYLLGARLPVDRSSGRVRYTWFSSHFRRVEMELETPEELWIYAYFPTLALELEVAMPPMTPYSLVFEGPYRPRPRESLLYLRQYFDTVRPSEVLQNSQFFMFPIFDLSYAFTISD